MPQYKAPMRDMRFLLNEVFDYEGHYKDLKADDASPDMVDAILEGCATFCEEVLAPLNHSGDLESVPWRSNLSRDERLPRTKQSLHSAGD